MDEEVEPLLHKYETNPGVAFNRALLPWQISNVPVMVGVGFGLMVAVCDALPVQPELLVTVTVYAPLVVVEMEDVVAPVFHK
jgi:hypothetical protein